MKRITFGASAQLIQHRKNDVVNILNEFLKSNGVFSASSTSHNGVDNSLVIKWNCANIDYTRAFGLLFLLFSNNPNGFISHRPDRCTIHVNAEKYTELYNYINERMNVIIEL